MSEITGLQLVSLCEAAMTCEDLSLVFDGVAWLNDEGCVMHLSQGHLMLNVPDGSPDVIGYVDGLTLEQINHGMALVADQATGVLQVFNAVNRGLRNDPALYAGTLL